MENSKSFIQEMHEEEGLHKIEKLQQKIDVTKFNIEVSQDIIAQTPYDAESNRLQEKNIQRRHAIGSLEKQIRDLKQTMEKRSEEMPT